MFTVWDSDKVKNLDATERFILENSYIPKFQWVEDSLKALDDKESYKRLSEIRNDLMSFLCSRKNNLLICSSNLGNGKTAWAVKLMLTYIELQKGKLNNIDENEVTVDNYDFCVFCQSIPFLVRMKQFGNNKDTYTMFNRLCKTQLAVIDDLGVVNMSQYDYNNIYAIVEERMFAGKPTIFTTNIGSIGEMKDILGPRLTDRIWNSSEVIEFKNRGFRGV